MMESGWAHGNKYNGIPILRKILGNDKCLLLYFENPLIRIINYDYYLLATCF
jgi:hypothetical protein